MFPDAVCVELDVPVLEPLPLLLEFELPLLALWVRGSAVVTGPSLLVADESLLPEELWLLERLL